ncbi:unnamed protein product [Oppiella nova]|uniref:Methyltransferase type 12 domain-containing protein n=1 Tax=Oppiella nova TaxID=334625 RepID=A0A7R9M208_9ACAR|nr:unnamed protein product [Oppiella nova]CAG2169307.1 unnamed protein product [Oppiella nova]
MRFRYILVNIICIVFVAIITTTVPVFGWPEGLPHEHSLSELLLTTAEPLIQPKDKCSHNWTQIFVHSAAKTSGKYYDRRTATRDTWASEALKHYMRVTFVLAYHKNPESIESQEIQRNITTESEKYGDILQFGFVDAYYNLTLKAISLLNWVSKECLVNDYIIKTDDDIVVNTERLRQRIDKKAFKSGITGYMAKGIDTKPPRNANSNWYMPSNVYPLERYPPYLLGAAYVMSTDIIDKLYRFAMNASILPVLRIDDLYLTGFVSQTAGIDRYDDQEFPNHGSDVSQVCDVNVCRLYDYVSYHGCHTGNNVRHLWNSWKNTTISSCLPHEHLMSELVLTKDEPLIQPKHKCSHNWTQILVYSATKTSGKYYDRRTATRDTWASEAFKHHMRVTFMYSYHKNPDSNESQEIQRNITTESEKYGDILQLGFVDSYYNLTLKAISLLNWISKKCLVNDYIIKTDDDIVVNTERLRQRKDKKAYKSDDRNYIILSLPNNNSISYTFGYFQIIDNMSKTLISGNGSADLKVEDFYNTGVIRLRANIPVHNDTEVFLNWLYSCTDSDVLAIVCKLDNKIAYHGCNTGDNMRRLWNRWIVRTQESCSQSSHTYYIEYDLVLDIGCGSGNITQTIGDILKVKQIYGIDVDKEMIGFATQNHCKPYIQYFAQDFGADWDVLTPELRALEGKVDLIFSNHCLHWIVNKQNVVKNLYKLLRKGSKFYANIYWISDLYMDLTGEEKAVHEKEFLKIPSKDTQFDIWHKLFKINGFDVISHQFLHKDVVFEFDFFKEHILPLTTSIRKQYFVNYERDIPMRTPEIIGKALKKC